SRGGGMLLAPGAMLVALLGALFLAELPGFHRGVPEVLREPLESGRITVSRAARQAEFPARFQLIAAMNPCPCGYLGHYSGKCHCTPEQVARYRNRISGPLLDRIDLHVEVPAVPEKELASRAHAESSNAIRDRVCAARERQVARQGKPNAHLAVKEIEEHCELGEEGQQLANKAISSLGLSARAHHRIMKAARTIADLAASPAIGTAHVA